MLCTLYALQHAVRLCDDQGRPLACRAFGWRVHEPTGWCCCAPPSCRCHICAQAAPDLKTMQVGGRTGGLERCQMAKRLMLCMACAGCGACLLRACPPRQHACCC